MLSSCAERAEEETGQPGARGRLGRGRELRTVMYVPPMTGSEICVWNAEMPTNWTVLRGGAEKGEGEIGLAKVSVERRARRQRDGQRTS